MLVRVDFSQELDRKDRPFPTIKGKLEWITVDVREFLIPHCKRQSRQPRALGSGHSQSVQVSEFNCFICAFRKRMGENSPSKW